MLNSFYSSILCIIEKEQIQLHVFTFLIKAPTFKGTGESGGLQAILFQYPPYKALIFKKIDLSKYDLDRMLYHSIPTALFRLDYIFDEDRIGMHTCNFQKCCPPLQHLHSPIS